MSRKKFLTSRRVFAQIIRLGLGLRTHPLVRGHTIRSAAATLAPSTNGKSASRLTGEETAAFGDVYGRTRANLRHRRAPVPPSATNAAEQELHRFELYGRGGDIGSTFFGSSQEGPAEGREEWSAAAPPGALRRRCALRRRRA